MPTDADVEQLTSDARFFLSALEGRLGRRRGAAMVVPFPSHEIDPYRGLSPHFDIASARARALHALSTGTARLVIASAAALLPRLSPPSRLKEAGLALRPGDEISPIDLGDRLAAAGYTRQDPTDEPGEFSVRGGVVDFYPAGARQPIRLEFIGDNIESLRTYDPGTQRSIEPIDQAHIVPLQELLLRTTEPRSSIAPPRSSTISPARSRRVVSEPDEVKATFVKQREQIEASYAEAVRKNRSGAGTRVARRRLGRRRAARSRRATALETLALGTEDEVRHVATQPAMEFSGRVPDWVAELRTRARRPARPPSSSRTRRGAPSASSRCSRDYQVPAAPIDRGEDAHAGAVLVAVGHLSKGFRLPGARPAALGRDRRLRRGARRRTSSGRSAAKTFLSDFRDLKVGDLVVHVDNGIGVFVGLKKIDGRPRVAGVHGAPLRRRRQALRPGRAARPRPEIHRRVATRARQARRHDAGRRRRRASRRRCATWRTSC